MVLCYPFLICLYEDDMQLKIKNISVIKLFGFLDYDIDFPSGDKLIITGPNGYGKTMLLKLVHYAISNDYINLEKTSFESFSIRTETGYVKYTNTNNGLKVESSLYGEELSAISIYDDHKAIFNSEKTKSILINSVRLNNEFESDDALEKQRHYLSSLLCNEELKQKDLVGQINYLFRELIDYSDMELAYQPLPDMLQQRIVGLISSIKRFNRFGLLSESMVFLNIDISALKCITGASFKINECLNEIYYLLSLHEDLIGRLELFYNLIENKHFAFKTLHISLKSGFHFINYAKINIPLNLLSSGEKNQVSILFDLIFLAEDGAVILIDEPEISLHISWQKSLLNEFENIAMFNNYAQLIIATHSPDVINDEWDISIDLYEKHVVNTGN